MRQLDFSASTTQVEARPRNRRRTQAQKTSLSLRTVLLGGATISLLYLLGQPLISISPAATSIRTTENSILISGSLREDMNAADIQNIRLRINGRERLVSITNRNYATRVPLVRGANTIQAIAGRAASPPLTVLAAIPPYDIWLELDWEGEGDVDLHLYWQGSGAEEDCYWEHKRTAAGAVLDFDNIVRDGPEHITMEKAVAGTYIVRVVYYAQAKRDPRTPIKFTVVERLDGGRIVKTFERVLHEVHEEQTLDTFGF